MESEKRKSHHIRNDLCTTRPKYRDGRQLKAVKVYTVAQESKYLLVVGIPSIKGSEEEILKQCALYGSVIEHRILEDYPKDETTEFTIVMLIKFLRIQSARIAKKKLDDLNFLGGSLHVCYALEYESIDDTREKLEDRRKSVARRLRQLETEEDQQYVTMDDDVEGNEASDVQPSTNAAETSSSQSTLLPPFPPPFIFSGLQPPPWTDIAESSLFPPLPPPPGSSSSHPLHWNGVSSSLSGQSTLYPPLPPPPGCSSLPPPPGCSSLPPPPGCSSLPPPTGCSSLPPPPGCSSSQPPHWNQVPSTPSSQPSLYLPPPPGHSRSEPHRINHFPTPPNDVPQIKNCPSIGRVQNVAESSAPDAVANKVDRLRSKPIVISDYKPKGAAPRLVPRQCKVQNSVQNGQSDEVNKQLRSTAFVLGSKVQGPMLPEKVEKKRKAFQMSETGDASVDATVISIRQKTLKLSSSVSDLHSKTTKRTESPPC